MQSTCTYIQPPPAPPVMTQPQIYANAITGLCSASIAVVTTFQEQLEWWIRITGGILGIAIAAVTLYRLVFHPNKPKHRHKS